MLDADHVYFLAKQNLTAANLELHVEHAALKEKRSPQEEATRILILEDDDDDYLMLEQIFNEQDDLPFEIPFCLVQVRDYEHAIEQLEASMWNFFIVDQKLFGHKTGLDFVHEIRARGIRTPCLMVTQSEQIPFDDLDRLHLKSGELICLKKSDLNFHNLLNNLEHLIEFFKE